MSWSRALLKAVSHRRSQARFAGAELASIAWSQAPTKAGLLWVRTSPTWAAFALLSTARFMLAFFFFLSAIYLLKPLVGTKCQWDEVWMLGANLISQSVFSVLWSRWRGLFKIGAAGEKLGFSILSAKGWLWFQTSKSKAGESEVGFEKSLALG